MKRTLKNPRILLALAGILAVLAGSLFLSGCGSNTDGKKSDDHSQHQH
jgi:PBP1b-binding outer membrane lipoprotein LpoB